MKSRSNGNHLQSRVAYLNIAAKYLAVHQPLPKTQPQPTAKSAYHSGCRVEDGLDLEEQTPGLGPSNRLSSHLRGVSRKGQIRLPAHVKHSSCKHCGTFFVAGKTLKTYQENRSKDGKKLWARLNARQCLVCGWTKRFPVGALREPRKSDRSGFEEGQLKQWRLTQRLEILSHLTDAP